MRSSFLLIYVLLFLVHFSSAAQTIRQMRFYYWFVQFWCMFSILKPNIPCLYWLQNYFTKQKFNEFQCMLGIQIFHFAHEKCNELCYCLVKMLYKKNNCKENQGLCDWIWNISYTSTCSNGILFIVYLYRRCHLPCYDYLLAIKILASQAHYHHRLLGL